jgi:hypothetical protein
MAAHTALEAVAALRETLADLGDALRDGDLALLCACEERLVRDVQAATAARGPVDAAMLADEIRTARAALERCRRIGSAVSSYADVVLNAAGIHTGYDRAGRAGGQQAMSRLHTRA